MRTTTNHTVLCIHVTICPKATQCEFYTKTHILCGVITDRKYTIIHDWLPLIFYQNENNCVYVRVRSLELTGINDERTTVQNETEQDRAAGSFYHSAKQKL